MPQLRRPARDHQDVTRSSSVETPRRGVSTTSRRGSGDPRPLSLCLFLALALMVACTRAPAASPTAAPAPTRASTQASPWPTATTAPTPSPAPTIPRDPIAALLAQPMPWRDPAVIAHEFLGSPMPNAAPRERLCRGREAQVGAQEVFWVDAGDTPGEAVVRPVTATLVLASPELQMWVESSEDSEAVRAGLARSAEKLRESILPALQRMLGPESPPDAGPCPLSVLSAHITTAGGFYSSSNRQSRALNPYSAERPLLVVSLDQRQPSIEDYDGALAHEIEHMIHDWRDPDEEAWVNEGLATLAEELAGYPDATLAREYLKQPNIALLSWSPEPPDGWAHYGGPQLVLRYLAQRYGVGALAELVAEPANSVVGVAAILQRAEPGQTWDALWADFLVAHVLAAPYPAGGRSALADLGVPPMTCQAVKALPFETEGQLLPYGAACFALPDDIDSLALTFEGQAQTRLVPTEPRSGAWLWWGNRGDRGHSSLRTQVDLRGVSTAALEYDVWYLIEEGWDYAYLRVSSDGGATWQLLQAPDMTTLDPTGNALGAAYTGASEGWLHQAVDLTPWAGREVWLSFDYLTDDAQNRPGLCLDNLAIAAIGWSDDVEAGAGRWQAQGFLRSDNRLPQRYLVQVATAGADGSIDVQRLAVGADGRAQARLALGKGRSYLILSATTPVTTEPAGYKLKLAAPGG